MDTIRCIVNHPNLFLSVGGKLQQVKKGAVVKVLESNVQRHLKNGNLQRYQDDAIDVGEDDPELKALRERGIALGIPNAGRMKAETLKEKIAEAENIT